MSKILITRYKVKAAVSVCLFLLVAYSSFSTARRASSSVESQWSFDDATQKVYELVLNLQLEQVHQIISKPETAQEHYVTALAEALELLITEDPEKFNVYEERFNERLERKTKTNSPHDLFLQAEIRMQWTFVYLKFGHEFDAALNLREAYITIQLIKEKFPSFQAIKKTSGLLEVMIGSVPQKYNWVLNLLGMEGSTKTGLEELAVARTSDALGFEAHLMHALIQGFLFQRPNLGLKELNDLVTLHPNNRIALFLGSALAMKNAQSEAALVFLDSLNQQHEGLPICFADYLRGEIYLHKGEYLNAISAYRWFINNYRGQNCIKDAHYKIGLCYWLNGNENDAKVTFKLAKSLGREASESDKHAARSLSEAALPHIQLTKARYAMDGGYYDAAERILDSLAPADMPTRRDKVEYNYRKARLAHKLNDLLSAKRYYLQCIDLNGDEPWYFAPNACLQMGYIVWNEGDLTLARNYFNKALTYNKHEYKNSIDSKAKSAMAQIKRK